ncbi:MAG: RDD family protein, partial [Gordonia amarae]
MYGSGVPAGGAGSGTIGVGADDLVSGEAVALDLPAANVALRVLSGLIDIIAGIALWFGLRYLGKALVGDTDDAMLIATLTVATILALVAFPTTMETVTRGKTLGHLALGLRT